jgi:hypothetical protein
MQWTEGMTKAWMALALGVGVSLVALPAEANHPVLLEGNNAANGAAGTTSVPPGTGGDYDGDGLVGVAEDTDNTTDRIFGTLSAAVAAANGAANANGHVMIVTSGRFGEALRISPVNGVTIIEAAPGVSANVDAVIAGDAAGNTTRQAGPGIVVDTRETDRTVILRNLVIRNYMVGLQVNGGARVVVENCRFDSNLAANVLATGGTRLTMTGCSVVAGGMRFNPMKGTPSPGHGISFTDLATGSIVRCTISGNTGAGINNGGQASVWLDENNIFDNSPNLAGKLFFDIDRN